MERRDRRARSVQNPLAVFVADHAGKKAARGFATAGTELFQHAADPQGLQPGKLERQKVPGRADIQQPLAPVGAFPLDDVTLID